VFCLSVVLIRLSVTVQVTDWKDSSPSDLYVDGDVKPHSLTHSVVKELDFHPASLGSIPSSIDALLVESGTGRAPAQNCSHAPVKSHFARRHVRAFVMQECTTLKDLLSYRNLQ